MSRRTATFFTLGLAMVVVASLPASVARGSDPRGLDRVSNAGTAVSETRAQDVRTLMRIGYPNATTRLLAANDGRGLYRIGSDCYGAGPLGSSANRFGSVSCDVDFPSADHPILNFTVIHGRFDDAGNVLEMKVWRSEGVASDGVEAVAFRTAEGAIVGNAPVTDNVYRHSAIPDGELVALVALDGSGNVIHSKPLR
jgi:hypothetical protein